MAPATYKRSTSPSDPTGSSCDGKHPGQQRISSFRGADLWLALNARAFDPHEANLRGAMVRAGGFVEHHPLQKERWCDCALGPPPGAQNEVVTRGARAVREVGDKVERASDRCSMPPGEPCK